MTGRPQVWPAIVCFLGAYASNASGQVAPTPTPDVQLQSAVAQYHAGQFATAAAQLESLLPHVPGSYEAHELLGLVYAAQSENTKAVQQFEVATRLKPDAAAARTNLATALERSGQLDGAGVQFRKALELEPQNFGANHNLGEFYLTSGKIADAIPFLKQAQQINRSSYNNGYDLAQADYLSGQLAEASQTASDLLQQKNTGELHALLGQIAEKDGKFVLAANEFETAAHLDPSEENLFDWGSEFLLHRTYEPAIEVFAKATERYPQSPRLFIGLGMSLYSRGKYDEAVKALLAAADLNPTDPRCYLFLSRAYDSSPNQADAVIQRFKRFSELQPKNALALYYYAMSLWKGKRTQDAGFDLGQVESLLQKSIALNPALPEAHVQLGNLHADQHEYAKSIPEYERALALNPNLPDAHYRLGQDYVHVGQKDRAQAEFDLYQHQRAAHMAELDKQRDEVRQFVYSAKGEPAAQP